jgi:hypothetical protein
MIYYLQRTVLKMPAQRGKVRVIVGAVIRPMKYRANPHTGRYEVEGSDPPRLEVTVCLTLESGLV